MSEMNKSTFVKQQLQVPLIYDLLMMYSEIGIELKRPCCTFTPSQLVYVHKMRNDSLSKLFP